MPDKSLDGDAMINDPGKHEVKKAASSRGRRRLA